MTRACVYIDGFNLYYRTLRRTPYKWLDIATLSRRLLGQEAQLEHIRYFTAPVSGKFDPSVPVRQRRYLQAIRSLPSVTIHLGAFRTQPKVRPLVDALPDGTTHVRIWNTEEKGSDVNLATYLLHDAWKDQYDVALVLSQDTDLVEPVRIVKEELGKPVGVAVLDGREPGKLALTGSFTRHIVPNDLKAAQLPERVYYGDYGKFVEKPVEWA